MDAKFAARDAADLLDLNIILCRNCRRRGQAMRAQRDTTARAPRSPKERDSAGSSFAMPRVDLPRERPSLSKQDSASGDGEAAVAHVVRGKNCALGCELHQAINQTLFRGQINRRRRACDNSVNRLRILGGRKFADAAASALRKLSGSAPSSSRIKSPSLRKPEPSAQSASSINPSTPRTGVG